MTIECSRCGGNHMRSECPTLGAVTVNAPRDLNALLATMKSAKKQGVHMAIWDRDIKMVEDAIATIDGVRRIQPVPNGER